MFIEVINKTIDKTNPIFAILDPITFPREISEWPDKAAWILTINSGAEVAKETTVMPIINFGIFRFIEIAKEPSKRYSPPFIRKNKPIIIAKKSILDLIASYV